MMTLPCISDVIIKYYLFSQSEKMFVPLLTFRCILKVHKVTWYIHLFIYYFLHWAEIKKKKKVTDEMANGSTVNLDATLWARSCTKVNEVSDYRVSSQWWMGEGPASGIMRKTPCGSWYMEHDHPWLIHVPRVTRPSLFSIGFMTSRSCNLSSCIMAMMSWHIFYYFFAIIIISEFL